MQGKNNVLETNFGANFESDLRILMNAIFHLQSDLLKVEKVNIYNLIFQGGNNVLETNFHAEFDSDFKILMNTIFFRK